MPRAIFIHCDGLVLKLNTVVRQSSIMKDVLAIALNK